MPAPRLAWSAILLPLSFAACVMTPWPDEPTPDPRPGAGTDDVGGPESPDAGTSDGGGAPDGGIADDGGAPATCGAAELHVIGVYEPAGHAFQQHVMQDATVRVDRPGHHALVLSAYEPVTWHVSVGPGVVLDQVIATGYYTPVVVGVAAATPVTLVSAEQGDPFACGYSWPYNGQGCDTNQLLAMATAATGLPLASFHGCYQADDWTLRADRSAGSSCATDLGYEQYDLLGACPE